VGDPGWFSPQPAKGEKNSERGFAGGKGGENIAKGGGGVRGPMGRRPPFAPPAPPTFFGAQLMFTEIVLIKDHRSLWGVAAGKGKEKRGEEGGVKKKKAGPPPHGPGWAGENKKKPKKKGGARKNTFPTGKKSCPAKQARVNSQFGQEGKVFAGGKGGFVDTPPGPRTLAC